MLQKVVKTIQKYEMLDYGDRVIVGLSGGADSVALLDILLQLKNEYNLQIFAAHINHGIRGEDAAADCEYCKDLCKKRGVPLFIREYNVPNIAREMRMSEEEAGRLVRYRAFQEILNQLKADKIAVAHHTNDNAETIIMRLCRGTGIQGLCGIRPVRFNIIRPLIDCSRKEIELYLSEKQVDFVTDSSNLRDDYVRNKIRHHILPRLKIDVNENAVANIAKATELLAEDNDFLQKYAEECYKKCIIRQTENIVELDAEAFCALHPAINKRIARFAIYALTGHLSNISLRNIEDFINIANGKTGRCIHLPGNLQVEKEYDKVVVKLNLEDFEPQNIGFHYILDEKKAYIKECDISISVSKQKDETADESRCFYIEKATDSIFVRSRRSGDRIYINKSGQTKKVKDMLIDLKIPKEQRINVPVICTNYNILWVYPYRFCSNPIAENFSESVYINIWHGK